ncbi:DUF4373 domain-containing protein [Spirosoma sp. RP8]|uniref:DUF4373 domain-containing protein n=1 Tax=Spirosoma liriopis TaxID=2937440 RepID=A0ABT0HF29_9BACT|nr:Lin1244/Lin1753 domain-containing protein [Spirosoma liriopis]MCK8490220.1 DUF4373 domain-containing protein [Spirosoma liriopis]
MKYFLHDTNALQDEKITELIMHFGYEGYGLFFAILEKLALHEKPIKTAVLKKQLSVGKKLEKAWAFMESIGLISVGNGETFNKNLLKFSENFQKTREKNNKRLQEWRENQVVPKNETDFERVRNASNSIVKYSNKKINKKSADADASSASLFDQFFNAYGKKIDKKKCQAKFEKLSLGTQQAILAHTPLYVRLNPKYEFRKNPLTYLNGECWNDPIEESKPDQATTSGKKRLVV